jgi:hypothetical protein
MFSGTPIWLVWRIGQVDGDQTLGGFPKLLEWPAKIDKKGTNEARSK